MIPYSLIDQERINSNGIQPRSCTWFNESNESQSVPAGDNGELISSDRLTVNGDVLLEEQDDLRKAIMFMLPPFGVPFLIL
jgi:hypothetical protein